MSILLGGIADDLIGANELGAILSRSGIPVNIRYGLPSGAADAGIAAFEVVALRSSDSSLASELTTEPARDAWQWLSEHGALRAYWKYSSGTIATSEHYARHVGRVADALLDALSEENLSHRDTRQTVHCLALAEPHWPTHSWLAHPWSAHPGSVHPGSVHPDLHLRRISWLEDAVSLTNCGETHTGPEELRVRLRELDKKQTHVLAHPLDAESLLNVTRATEHLPLLCGSSALALHLPALLRVRGYLAGLAEMLPAPAPEGGRLVLSADCSEQGHRQLENFDHDAPVLLLDATALDRDERLEEAKIWLKSQPDAVTPLITAKATSSGKATGTPAASQDDTERRLEQALGELARTAVELGRRSLVVAGRQTAETVCDALGIDTLTVGQEICAGLPWMSAQHPGGPLALAFKPDTWGHETFLSDAFKVLDTRPLPKVPSC